MLKRSKKFKILVLISAVLISSSFTVGCGNKEKLVGNNEVNFYEEGLKLVSPDSSYMRGNLEDKIEVDEWKEYYKIYELDESQECYVDEVYMFVDLIEDAMSDNSISDNKSKEIVDAYCKILKSYENYKIEER